MTAEPISVRLPRLALEIIERLVARTGLCRSQIIIRAVEQFDVRLRRSDAIHSNRPPGGIKTGVALKRQMEKEKE
jgi:hypothetical protein